MNTRTRKFVGDLVRRGQISEEDAQALGNKVVRGKYRNVKSQYDGVAYDSAAEARRASELDLLLAAGDIRGWQRQVTFRLGSQENAYRVDFLVWLSDGTTHAEDVKGFETAKFKADARRWRRHGPCPLRIITGKKVKVVMPDALEGT